MRPSDRFLFESPPEARSCTCPYLSTNSKRKSAALPRKRSVPRSKSSKRPLPSTAVRLQLQRSHRGAARASPGRGHADQRRHGGAAGRPFAAGRSGCRADGSRAPGASQSEPSDRGLATCGLADPSGQRSDLEVVDQTRRAQPRCTQHHQRLSCVSGLRCLQVGAAA